MNAHRTVKLHGLEITDSDREILNLIRREECSPQSEGFRASTAIIDYILRVKQASTLSGMAEQVAARLTYLVTSNLLSEMEHQTFGLVFGMTEKGTAVLEEVNLMIRIESEIRYGFNMFNEARAFRKEKGYVSDHWGWSMNNFSNAARLLKRLGQITSDQEVKAISLKSIRRISKIRDRIIVAKTKAGGNQTTVDIVTVGDYL